MGARHPLTTLTGHWPGDWGAPRPCGLAASSPQAWGRRAALPTQVTAGEPPASEPQGAESGLASPGGSSAEPQSAPPTRLPVAASGRPLTAWSPAWSRRAPASRPRRASSLLAPAGRRHRFRGPAKAPAHSRGAGPALRDSMPSGAQRPCQQWPPSRRSRRGSGPGLGTARVDPAPLPPPLTRRPRGLDWPPRAGAPEAPRVQGKLGVGCEQPAPHAPHPRTPT